MKKSLLALVAAATLAVSMASPAYAWRGGWSFGHWFGSSDSSGNPTDASGSWDSGGDGGGSDGGGGDGGGGGD